MGALTGLRVLVTRPAAEAEESARAIREAGARVRPVAAYRMAKVPPERLAGAAAALRRGEVELVPLGSPRTAEVLLGALGPDGPALLARCAVGAIGGTTAAALQRAGVAV